jgi:chromosome segregation ATPase
MAPEAEGKQAVEADDFTSKEETPFGDDKSAEAASPGGELFGDVVKSKDERKKRPARPPGAPEEELQLRDSVAGLYDMVKDLEVQLNHMISINEAAERDLESARRAQRELEKERDGLLRKLQQTEQDAESGAALREELRHTAGENNRLLEQLRAAESRVERWEQQRLDAEEVRAKLQAERDDVREEVDCLEAQLAETARCLESLREALSKQHEGGERDRRKFSLLEERLHVVTEERDALRQELQESKSALEEIKRSIMDTTMQSQTSYYES